MSDAVGALAVAAAVVALPGMGAWFAILAGVDRLKHRRSREVERPRRRLPPWPTRLAGEEAPRPPLDVPSVALLTFGYALAGCCGLFIGWVVWWLSLY